MQSLLIPSVYRYSNIKLEKGKHQVITLRKNKWTKYTRNLKTNPNLIFSQEKV